MPEPTRDLRARVYDAALSILGPRNEAGDPHPDAEHITDAVMAVIDEEFPRPLLTLDPPPEMSPDDVAAWHAAWAETFNGDTQARITVLPPNAVAIRRRTPEQRHAYLLDHRDEAIANGIPEDLIDMLIADAEAAADDTDPDADQ